MGKFTAKGLELLADWMDDNTQTAKIKYMGFGELTDAQYAELDYSGNETALTDQKYFKPLNYITLDAADNKIVRFEAILGDDPDMPRNWTVREVGLFADDPDGGDPVLVWIGKHPSTYIPAANLFPDMEIGEIVSVPIRFNNPEAIAPLETTNAALATIAYTILCAAAVRAESGKNELEIEEELTLLKNYVLHN